MSSTELLEWDLVDSAVKSSDVMDKGSHTKNEMECQGSNSDSKADQHDEEQLLSSSSELIEMDGDTSSNDEENPPRKCAYDKCCNLTISGHIWDEKYCCLECKVEHCKDVFAAWVERNQREHDENQENDLQPDEMYYSELN